MRPSSEDCLIFTPWRPWEFTLLLSHIIGHISIVVCICLDTLRVLKQWHHIFSFFNNLDRLDQRLHEYNISCPIAFQCRLVKTMYITGTHIILIFTFHYRCQFLSRSNGPGKIVTPYTWSPPVPISDLCLWLTTNIFFILMWIISMLAIMT